MMMMKYYDKVYMLIDDNTVIKINESEFSPLEHATDDLCRSAFSSSSLTSLTITIAGNPKGCIRRWVPGGVAR